MYQKNLSGMPSNTDYSKKPTVHAINTLNMFKACLFALAETWEEEGLRTEGYVRASAALVLATDALLSFSVSMGQEWERRVLMLMEEYKVPPKP
jgi:hypothetical protein